MKTKKQATTGTESQTNPPVKEKNAWWTKALIVCVVAIAFFGVVLSGAVGYFRLSVHPYYKASEKAFVIPDLDEEFVPQGMQYDERENCFFITGYNATGAASPVYMVDKASGKTLKKVLLLQEDGTAFTGHAGGIGVYGEYVYVAGGDEKCLYAYAYSEILAAEQGAGVRCKGVFSTATSETDYVDVSFIAVHGDKIVVGEFYREQNYPTLPSHKITTSGGDYNQALALEFALSATAPLGIDPIPCKAYSITDQVQGMCFFGDTVYLSTSYGLAFSHILAYDAAKLTKEASITVLGTEVALYSLDRVSLVRDYKIAPMSEEVDVVDGKLYVMCESASDKYIFGKLTGGRWCYKTALSEMK